MAHLQLRLLAGMAANNQPPLHQATVMVVANPRLVVTKRRRLLAGMEEDRNKLQRPHMAAAVVVVEVDTRDINVTVDTFGTKRKFWKRMLIVG